MLFSEKVTPSEIVFEDRIANPFYDDLGFLGVGIQQTFILHSMSILRDAFIISFYVTEAN